MNGRDHTRVNKNHVSACVDEVSMDRRLGRLRLMVRAALRIRNIWIAEDLIQMTRRGAV